LGLIKRQAIQGTIFTYTGVVLGFVTTALLFPRFLETNEIGLLSILVSYTLIFAQFSSLGFNSVTSRLFPYFRDNKNSHNGFLFIALTVSLAGFILVLIAFFLLNKYYFVQRFETSPLLIKYVYYIIPLTFFTVFFNTLDNYYKVLFKSVQGLFLKEFLQKMLTLVSTAMYILNWINFSGFVLLYISSICLPTLIITVMIIKDGQFNIIPKRGFISKDLAKTMVGVSAFGILASATGIVTLNIDRIMIEFFLGLSLTGVYTTTFYFGSLIIMPSRSLLKVTSVFIADAWKENNLQIIKEIYYKSSINQFLIALLLLIGIWVNIDNIYFILGEKFLPGKYVILWISMAYTFDMLLGVGGNVIGLSKYYRNQTYFMLIQVILIIATNYYLIPKYGIVGAAFATALSKLLYNFIRYLFIYIKFKLQPFNLAFLILLIIGLLSYFVGYKIPRFDNFIIDIAIRSMTVLIIYVSLALIFRISVDVNEKFSKIVNKVFNLSKV